MLTLTRRAGIVLRTLLDQRPISDRLFVRLDLHSEGCALAIDQERTGDEAVSFEGKKTIIMDPYTAESCVGRMLDCNGMEFILRAGYEFSDS